MSTIVAPAPARFLGTDTSLRDEMRTIAMIWQREIIRFVRTRTRILTGLIQPVLFLFAFGYGISPLVG